MGYERGIYFEFRGVEDGPLLILSSGLGGSANYWNPNIRELAKTFRILVYDHRGTGRSDRDMIGASSVANMAEDVTGLMDVLGIERAHFVGHAAGGLIGLKMALRAPERLNKLIVVNGWSRLDPHFNRCFETRLALLKQVGPAAYIRAQPIFLYPANWISENDEHLEAEAQDLLADFAGISNLERRIAALRAFDIEGQLETIRANILLLASEDDMLVPSRCSRHLASRIPDASLHVMPWGGHACNVTAPDAFVKIVRNWLMQEDY